MDGNIKNLENLLQSALEPNTEILNISTKRLTAAGENYGSLMLAIEVNLKNGAKKTEKTLNLVAKLCPPNEFLKKMFNVGVSFRKEIAMYNTIIPTLKKFQKEQGISKTVQFLCDCYGARINLNPKSDRVDDDAVLILENLKVSGFDTVERMKGFNLETTQLLLKDLAVFHAVPIAFKLLQPEVFKTKILPYLTRNDVFDTVSTDAEKAILDFIIETAKDQSECVPLLDRVKKRFTQSFHFVQTGVPIREPFATITHNDFWVNNMMLKFENNNPTQSKFVDFQVIDYGSPGKDIVFLLFSSVQKSVLDSHWNDLLKLYYDTFIATLKDLKCDVAPFTFPALLEEIAASAKTTEFSHILIMVRHIFALKGKVKEIDEITMDDLTSIVQISDEYRQRVPEIILEFAKRNWI